MGAHPGGAGDAVKIAIYAESGRIGKGLAVRLTGNRRDGAYEATLPGIGRRAHAIVIDCPPGDITPSALGYALAFGPIVEARAAASLATDEDVTPTADGTLDKSASGDRRCVGSAITAATAGGPFLLLLRWSGRP